MARWHVPVLDTAAFRITDCPLQARHSRAPRGLRPKARPHMRAPRGSRSERCAAAQGAPHRRSGDRGLGRCDCPGEQAARLARGDVSELAAGGRQQLLAHAVQLAHRHRAVIVLARVQRQQPQLPQLVLHQLQLDPAARERR